MPLDRRVPMTFFLKIRVNNGQLLEGSGNDTSRAANAEHYQRICDAPCAVRVPLGTYTVGLSLHGGKTLAAP